MIPLEEIISDIKGVGVATKTVRKEYKSLIRRLKTEFNILLDADIDEIRQASSYEVAEGIRRVRNGELRIEPGYDGEFGKINIFNDKERSNFEKQNSLF